MKRRSLFVGLMVAALAATGAFSSASFAATTSGVSSSGAPASHRLAKVNAKVKATRVKYEATYTDEKFGPVFCKGVHITSAKYPGSGTVGGADKFKCKSTTGKPLTFGNPGETFAENFTAWASDYDGQLAKSLNATESKNGKSYKGIAVYPTQEELEKQQKEKEEKEQKEKEEKEQKEKEEKEKEEEEEEV
jgi:hypothetical protein